MSTPTERSSSIGSDAFALVSLLVIALAVLLIQRHYLPLRTTPAYLLVPVFFALGLPASMVLLVPIDLASSSGADDVAARGIWLPQPVLLVSWRITYWLTFALTWFVLPILAEYSDAGYRDLEARLMYSLKSNARYQAIVMGTAIVGGVYVFMTAGVQFVNLKVLVMALAYVWGLVLAIYLMGHGLVSIPRTLFRNASISGRLRRIHVHAPKVHEKMEEAINKLDDVEAQVAELAIRTTGSARDYKEWIEELVELSNMPDSRPNTLSRRMSSPTVSVPAVITDRYLADITRQLDRARHSRIRWIDEWNRLVQDAVDTEAILNSRATKELEIGKSSPQASFLERLTLFTPYSRYVYYSHVVPYFRLALGAFLSIASVAVVWSEVVKGLPMPLSIVSYTVVLHPGSNRGEIGFAGQCISALWICYMCAAALISITEIKVWRGRALVRRNTAYEAAFWYAMQVARLSVPLTYNFMTFLQPKDIYKSTTFYKFLGSLIDLTPLGKWFDYLFPCFILLPVCATLFNLYGRVKRLLGFGIIDEDEEENLSGYGTGGWREGRDLIERETTHMAGSGIGGLSHGSVEHAGPRPNYRPTPSERHAAGTHTSSASTPGHSRSTPRNEGDTDNENFFEALGHRMRNTMDTMQKPRWMQDGFKKPKWLGGDEETSSNGPFTRLFGGSNADSRVRL